MPKHANQHGQVQISVLGFMYLADIIIDNGFRNKGSVAKVSGADVMELIKHKVVFVYDSYSFYYVSQVVSSN